MKTNIEVKEWRDGGLSTASIALIGYGMATLNSNPVIAIAAIAVGAGIQVFKYWNQQP